MDLETENRVEPGDHIVVIEQFDVGTDSHARESSGQPKKAAASS